MTESKRSIHLKIQPAIERPAERINQSQVINRSILRGRFFKLERGVRASGSILVATSDLVSSCESISTRSIQDERIIEISTPHHAIKTRKLTSSISRVRLYEEIASDIQLTEYLSTSRRASTCAAHRNPNKLLPESIHHVRERQCWILS